MLPCTIPTPSFELTWRSRWGTRFVHVFIWKRLRPCPAIDSLIFVAFAKALLFFCLLGFFPLYCLLGWFNFRFLKDFLIFLGQTFLPYHFFYVFLLQFLSFTRRNDDRPFCNDYVVVSPFFMLLFGITRWFPYSFVATVLLSKVWRLPLSIASFICFYWAVSFDLHASAGRECHRIHLGAIFVWTRGRGQGQPL